MVLLLALNITVETAGNMVVVVLEVFTGLVFVVMAALAVLEQSVSSGPELHVASHQLV